MFILEEQREIPVTAEVDVLVIGSGPAGVSAAVTAGREGMSTMLIEQTGDVGGIATVGLMSHWTGDTKGGIYEEILQRSSDEPDDKEKRIIINPEKLKTVLLEMLDEAGVKVLLYTFASRPVMEGNTIKGVIIENKSGRQAIMAKIVIDASGDGDMAAQAGVPYIKGRETDGKMQPVTIMFKVAGVKGEEGVFPGAFEDHLPIPAGDIQELGEKNLPFPAGHVLLYKTTLPGVVTCNMTNCIDIDGTKTEDLTHATIVCRKQMDAIVKFLREYVPGFENCFLISSASLIGVRETRHFKGEETCCNSKCDTISKKELVNPIIGKKVIKIEGMHCDHCKQKVTSALNDLEGVSADVDLKNNCAIISYDHEIDKEIIKNTLKNAGYSVVSIKML